MFLYEDEEMITGTKVCKKSPDKADEDSTTGTKSICDRVKEII